MRVICPNCDRGGVIDAESLSDLSSRAVCPRCAAPYRAAPTGFESARAATAAPRAPASPPAFITARASASRPAPRASDGARLRATTPDEGEDVLALMRADALDDAREDAAGVMLYLDGGLFARELRARPRAAADKYRIAARLMNVPPPWLLAACAGFFALVFVFDLLLTPARRAGGEASAPAYANNQATNRAGRRRAPAADSVSAEELAADETDRDAGGAQTADDEDSPADDGATAGRNELKRAPVSDAPVAPVDKSAHAAGVAFANASEEIDAGAGVEARPPGLTIQLGSFRVVKEAEAQAGTLRAAGFDARVVEQQNSKRPWYCVQTGLFGARADAERHLAELRAKGLAASYTLREIQ
ncbi:MAG TPA: SPOR domain-containing protein [Pyrinomonadaceae bacterium]|jgi:cell division septation protein DedD|nr:SPOR domain-containing protein [Pyrinomonadaceae bacterium]